MTVPNPPDVGTAPTPGPSTLDPINFDGRTDAFHAFFPDWVNVKLVAVLQWIRDRANEMLANSNAAAAAAAAATAAANSTAVQNASANAAAAQAAATAAGQYAAQAQATNPDSPIRLNPRRVSNNLTIPANYNAASAGPIAIDDGVNVTVAPGGNWSIH